MTRPRRPSSAPLVRRDAHGVERTAPTWETLTERLIREAQEAGAFDDLPHQGTSLPLEDDSHAGDWAPAYRLLRNAGAAPPWIEVDKEIRHLRHRIKQLLASAGRSSAATAERLEPELDALAEAHDDAVRCLEELAPTPRQHRRRLDRSGLRARLRGGPGTERGPR